MIVSSLGMGAVKDLKIVILKFFHPVSKIKRYVQKQKFSFEILWGSLL